MPTTAVAPTTPIATESFLPEELKGLPREIVHAAIFFRNRGRPGTPTPRKNVGTLPHIRRRYFTCTDDEGMHLIILVDEQGHAWTYPGTATADELPSPWTWGGNLNEKED